LDAIIAKPFAEHVVGLTPLVVGAEVALGVALHALGPLGRGAGAGAATGRAGRDHRVVARTHVLLTRAGVAATFGVALLLGLPLQVLPALLGRHVRPLLALLFVDPPPRPPVLRRLQPVPALRLALPLFPFFVLPVPPAPDGGVVAALRHGIPLHPPLLAGRHHIAPLDRGRHPVPVLQVRLRPGPLDEVREAQERVALLRRPEGVIHVGVLVLAEPAKRGLAIRAGWP